MGNVAEAAAEAGVKVEKLPAFALVDTPPGATPAPNAEPQRDEAPDMQCIKQSREQA